MGEYCHRCGEKKVDAHDLSFRHFVAHSLHDLAHLDSKIFLTVRYLITRPGFLTQEYVAGRRLRYAKPLSLLLTASALLLLLDSIYPLSSMASGYDVRQVIATDHSGQLMAAIEKRAASKHLLAEVVLERAQNTWHRIVTAGHLANILAMALVLAVLYRRRYFTEHLVFACHFLAFTFLAVVVVGPLSALFGPIHLKSVAITGWFTLLCLGLYLFFALRRVYGQGIIITSLKTIVVTVVTQTALLVTLIFMLIVALWSATRL